MIAFFSVGLIFLSGVSYPLELMPWYWRAAHYVFPAAPGTLAFVKVNSMGASMADIRAEYVTLWVQCAVISRWPAWLIGIMSSARCAACRPLPLRRSGGFLSFRYGGIRPSAGRIARNAILILCRRWCHASRNRRSNTPLS